MHRLQRPGEDLTKWRVVWMEHNYSIERREFDSFADACRAAADIPTQKIGKLTVITIIAPHD